METKEPTVIQEKVKAACAALDAYHALLGKAAAEPPPPQPPTPEPQPAVTPPPAPFSFEGCPEGPSFTRAALHPEEPEEPAPASGGGA